MVADPSTTSLGLEYFCNRGDEIWEMADVDLIDLGAQLSALGFAGPEAVLDARVIRQPKAYPVYDEDYRQNVQVVRRWLDSLENFQTIGRNGMHRYNNQDHSMLTAMLAVENLMVRLARPVGCQHRAVVPRGLRGKGRGRRRRARPCLRGPHDRRAVPDDTRPGRHQPDRPGRAGSRRLGFALLAAPRQRRPLVPARCTPAPGQGHLPRRLPGGRASAGPRLCAELHGPLPDHRADQLPARFLSARSVGLLGARPFAVGGQGPDPGLRPAGDAVPGRLAQAVRRPRGRLHRRGASRCCRASSAIRTRSCSTSQRSRCSLQHSITRAMAGRRPDPSRRGGCRVRDRCHSLLPGCFRPGSRPVHLAGLDRRMASTDGPSSVHHRLRVRTACLWFDPALAHDDARAGSLALR